MEYYEKAAKWWTDEIRKKNSLRSNSEEAKNVGGVAKIMATLLATKKQPDSEISDLFEKKLAEVIRQYVKRHGSLTLKCDYSPDIVLGNVARETRVDVMKLPWKTNMHITPQKVEVCHGYGAAYKTIYPETE